MAGRIVKISKGEFNQTAKKDISYYAKNINTNAAVSVNETGGDGIVFGFPKPAVPWKMPKVAFPEYRSSYQKTMPKEVVASQNTPAPNLHTTHLEKESEDSTEKEDCIKITIAVFFDGTGNNRYNTNARWLYKKRKYGTRGKTTGEKLKTNGSENENEHADHYKGILYGTKGNVWGSSYQNDLSNVARLEKFYETKNLTPTHVVDKVYVEGVGTQNGKHDDLTSAKDGEGASGIRKKIESSIKEIGDKITFIADERTIEELTFNVYGFSRGAATARNFIHEITQEKGALKEKSLFKKTYFSKKFGLLGEEIDPSKVQKMTINFAGLFDTVSALDSDGLDNGLFGDKHYDVEELHLDAVNKAKEVVHFAAADEHRKNFALTTTSKGMEKYLPGVHSDIGGCYANGEEIVGLLYKGSTLDVKKEAQWLINQGWYNKKQLSTFVLKKEEGEVKKKGLRGTRNLSKNYSFIPLELMGILSNKQAEINIKLNKLEAKYHIHAVDPNKNANNNDVPELELKQKRLLTYFKNRLHDYVLYNGLPITFYSKQELLKRSTDIDYITMKQDSDNLLKLRNQFLHFSSDYSILSIGMSPNIKNGKRTRKIFHG